MDHHTPLEDQLEDLTAKIVRLGALVEEAIAKSVEALIDRRSDVAREVLAGDQVIEEEGGAKVLPADQAPPHACDSCSDLRPHAPRSLRCPPRQVRLGCPALSAGAVRDACADLSPHAAL